MLDGMGVRRRHRRAAAGVIGLVAVALALAACTSSPTGGGAISGQASGEGNGSGGGSATGAATVSITPSGGQSVNPATPIVIKASNGTLSSVTVTNTVKGTVVTGDYSSDKSTWTSNEDLGYGATYAVDAVAADGSGKSVTRKANISTLTPSSTVYPGMIPAPSAVSSTGIGVGLPISFQFDKPVVNKKAVQAALTVTTSPPQQGAWYWISADQVDYRGAQFWQAGTTITVDAKIYGVDFGNGVYGETDRTVTYHVHDAWIAKADGNTEQMQISDNGTVVKTMPISMGKQSTPTHTGIHVISAKNQSIDMNSCTYGICSGPKAYNETEYWAERITNDGEFVHENPATVGQQGSANVSHGCINLSEANAEWFFNHLGIGDVVEVSNSGGPPIPVYDLYGDWSVPWSTWQAGNA